MLTLFTQFWTAVDDAGGRAGLSNAAELPVRLSWAASQVLSADAAGMSVTVPDGSLRIPLGASTSQASVAEALQFTAGQGPCLDAHRDQQIVLADEAVIAASWPIFARQLSWRTPFRSICAVPLNGVGVLDLYFLDPQSAGTVSTGNAQQIAAQIRTTLTQAWTLTPLEQDQGVWDTPAAQRRASVSIALGLVSVTLGLAFPDTLSVLRAYAFRTDRDLDDVAAALVDGSLLASDLA